MQPHEDKFDQPSSSNPVNQNWFKRSLTMSTCPWLQAIKNALWLSALSLQAAQGLFSNSSLRTYALVYRLHAMESPTYYSLQKPWGAASKFPSPIQCVQMLMPSVIPFPWNHLFFVPESFRSLELNRWRTLGHFLQLPQKALDPFL